MTGNAHRSRSLTISPEGDLKVIATFVANDTSQTREFRTTFEADAWLDVKEMMHLTQHIIEASTEAADRIAVVAAAAGIMLDDWQVKVLRTVLAAGPETPGLIATSDRRETPVDRRAVA